MNLKNLALLVCISQVLSLLMLMYPWFVYRGGYNPLNFMTVAQVILHIPLILFFFYVWKRQKS